MRVPGLIYADEALLESILHDRAIEQVVNVATLPGIVGKSLAMPDIHWGYGFAVGGVAATRVDAGVISPGGIGYDIGCGVRLLATSLTADEVQPRIGELADTLYRTVPAGVGERSAVRFGSSAAFDQVLQEGARWAVQAGHGLPEDLERIEEGGTLVGADPGAVSQRARDRGRNQVGSLGSGNHFLEVQRVDEVYDAKTAEAFGLWKGQVTVFIHTGSRGFGHQVCTDALHVMGRAVQHYGITLPDRQLACTPISSPEGQAYLGAMACAGNFAWANRQCITHWAREALRTVFGDQGRNVRLVYDVAHNMAKFETYEVDGELLELCVHRKGATRAFPPGHPALSPEVRPHGQPVLIPGDMGRYSYVAVGTEQAIRESFGSTCHGAGRLQSRMAAKRALKGVDVAAELERRGIIVRAQNRRLLAEEASEAYKDVATVMDVVERAGLSRTVARLRPLAVIKG
jgi:tRNA-splicing ligase RtcB